MPNYCFICQACDDRKTIFRPIEDYDLLELCDCGNFMVRDFVAEHCSVRGDYKEPIVSDSMAFDAQDLVEHRKRFPDIEVVVDHARSARPVFKSLGQKREYLKKRGWVDANSYF